MYRCFFQKLYPVSIHAKYGGWFAFRAIIILQNRHLPGGMKPVEPIDTVKDGDKSKLLTLFNENWKDGQYRNINNPQTQYSPLQQEYFNTAPKDRAAIIKRILSLR